MAIEIHGLAPLLQVFDMARSIGFYRDLLGFEILSTSRPGDDFGWALLRLNGVELMLNTAYDDGERPSVPDPRRVAAHADTSLFFGCSNVDGAYEELLAKGVDLKPPSIAPYGMKQLYLKDPDGFELCFQWPAAEKTRDQWRNWYGVEFGGAA